MRCGQSRSDICSRMGKPMLAFPELNSGQALAWPLARNAGALPRNKPGALRGGERPFERVMEDLARSFDGVYPEFIEGPRMTHSCRAGAAIRGILPPFVT